MHRRHFLRTGAAALWALHATGLPARSTVAEVTPENPLQLSSRFRRLQAPETGRRVLQLTWGDAECYPLYY